MSLHAPRSQTIGAIGSVSIVGFVVLAASLVAKSVASGLCVLLGAIVLGGGLAVAALAAVRVGKFVLERDTVSELELLPHAISWRCLNDMEPRTWSVHDVVELWPSRDLFSGVLGAKMRSGEVAALRIAGEGQTRWVHDLVTAWCGARGTAPDPEKIAQMAALGAVAPPERT